MGEITPLPNEEERARQARYDFYTQVVTSPTYFAFFRATLVKYLRGLPNPHMKHVARAVANHQLDDVIAAHLVGERPHESDALPESGA